MEKQGQKAQKETVINIKPTDITNIKIQATNEAVDRAFMLMISIPISIMHDKYGWGKVRCERLVEQILDRYEAYNKGFVSLEDLEQCLWDEGGIKIENNR